MISRTEKSKAAAAVQRRHVDIVERGESGDQRTRFSLLSSLLTSPLSSRFRSCSDNNFFVNDNLRKKERKRERERKEPHSPHIGNVIQFSLH
jgi:hypothetical protein